MFNPSFCQYSFKRLLANDEKENEEGSGDDNTDDPLA